MPVKIITGPSDPRNGLINENQMNDAIEEFRLNVTVCSVDAKKPIHKTLWCSFDRTEILQLLGVTNAPPDPGIAGIRIYFGVHPDNQQSCEGDDFSNKMNTMIFATDAAGNDIKAAANNDQMLIPGYNAFLVGGSGGACCG
ncbi:MAG: hypothetical protein ACXWCZ_11845, partial [Flavisolibacter sp.]